MMSRTHWGVLTVKRFFQGLYWSGETPPLEDTPTRQETQENINWLNLNAGEFFHRANWRGLPTTKPVPVSTPKVISLVSSVEEYFQNLPWQGEPGVRTKSPIPKEELPLVKTRSPELNLENLSSLF